MAVTIEICPKCKKRKKCNAHHIYPVRYYKSHDRYKDITVQICFECHHDLELILREAEKRNGGQFSDEFYPAAYKAFIA